MFTHVFVFRVVFEVTFKQLKPFYKSPPSYHAHGKPALMNIRRKQFLWKVSKLQGYQEHSSAPFFSSLLPDNQKAFPRVVQWHSFTCPAEGEASVLLSTFLSLLSLFLYLFPPNAQSFLLFFFFSFPVSSHFPQLSSVNSSRLTPSSASFFVGAVMLLALMFPSREKGRLGHTSTQIRE